MQQKYINEYKCYLHLYRNDHTKHILRLYAHTQCTVTMYVCIGLHVRKYCRQFVVFTNTQMHHPSPSIHNWPSIMPEFICMVPAEVSTGLANMIKLPSR